MMKPFLAGITHQRNTKLEDSRVFKACMNKSETASIFHAGITFEGKVQLVAFCVFEACVGIFWPSMMKLRSQYLPEESRSTIINFFRIPLNLFVCIMLYNVSPTTSFCKASCSPASRTHSFSTA